jgi:hypothetical protein
LFAKPSDYSGGGNFFKPKELAVAPAILFEPKDVQHNQPRTYNNVQTGTGTDVIADITVFENQAHLDGSAAPTVMKGVRIDKVGVVNRLERVVGQAMVGRLTKETTKAGNTAWVLTDVDDATTEKVAAYFTKRSEAAAAAPSFG